MDNQQNGIIEELLTHAEAEELREFLLKMEGSDTAFAEKLNRWLLKKYSGHIKNPSVYVDEVRRLFGLRESKYRGYNRWRYYDEGLDWFSLEIGMEELVKVLRKKLEDGEHDVVVPAVAEFYRLLPAHLDEFLAEDEPNIDNAAHACDDLLLAWAAHPDVPLSQKQSLYTTLKTYAEAEIMNYVDGLTKDFFLNYQTNMQGPEAALASIEQLTAEGKVTEAQVHRHIALLRHFSRGAEALVVIRRNLHHLSVLDAELERLYECGDDYAAVNLLDLAIAQSPLKSTHLYQRCIRFLQRAGDTEKLIRVYRYLLLNLWNGFDYYHQLKALVPADEWPEQYKHIVEYGHMQCSTEVMMRIYAEEHDYPALYQSLKSTHDDLLNLLAQYMPLLPQEYHEELLMRAYQKINKEADKAKKRSEYACVVSKIRQFSELPGTRSLTEVMVRNIRDGNQHRPAYLDELSKL